MWAQYCWWEPIEVSTFPEFEGLMVIYPILKPNWLLITKKIFYAFVIS